MAIATTSLVTGKQKENYTGGHPKGREVRTLNSVEDTRQRSHALNAAMTTSSPRAEIRITSGRMGNVGTGSSDELFAASSYREH